MWFLCEEKNLHILKPWMYSEAAEVQESLHHEKTKLGFPVSHSWLTVAAELSYSSPESHFSFLFFQVNVDDTTEMLPKSRRALTIQEIAALARSSLHGEYNIKQIF